MSEELISRMQTDVTTGKCPIMNDSRILQIPIIDQKEELVDIVLLNNESVQMMTCPAVPYVHPNYSAGFDCSKYVRKSVYDRLIALAKNATIMRGKETIVYVFEGLRDIETQKKIYSTCIEQIRSDFPEMSDEDVQSNAMKQITPPTVYLPFATGACVSVRLFDKETSTFLDMGKFGFNWFPGRVNNEANTFCALLSDEQKNNRRILLEAGSFAGLVNYPYEWWHFSFGDRYFSYYTQNKVAIHGMI